MRDPVSIDRVSKFLFTSAARSTAPWYDRTHHGKEEEKEEEKAEKSYSSFDWQAASHEYGPDRLRDIRSVNRHFLLSQPRRTRFLKPIQPLNI